MNPDMVQFDVLEVHRIQRIIYPRWMGGGMTPELWDVMSYPDQCDVIETKRAVDANTQFNARKK